jgi:transcriptional regulator with XRE-family HTH domain
MNRDWKRLGDAIKARREELGMRRQQDLADAAGISRASAQSLESGNSGEGWKRTPLSLEPARKALGWEPETVARYLTPAAPEVQNGATPRLAEGMPARVVRELSAGQVVDTEVVELDIPGLPFKFVGILKHDASAPDATPEEMQRALQAWSRVQRAMRGITDDQSGSGDQY